MLLAEFPQRRKHLALKGIALFHEIFKRGTNENAKCVACDRHKEAILKSWNTTAARPLFSINS